MKKESYKIENPKLFIVVFLLFIISISVLFFGINKISQNLGYSDQKIIEESEIREEESQESLSELFDNAKFSSETGGTDEYFLEKDPFQEVCAGSLPGDNQVSISFGTVCYR